MYYYAFVNDALILAYFSAYGNPIKQKENVTSVLRTIAGVLQALS